ncbi:MAG: OmpH family outer membrane protein [Bacteroidales bacterium]|jgi:outer membrane protein|nr:OmpH family outer membrane protein [Bacteroidales bacterium]MCR5114927.1 OmpH family outer membrane protein [Bacteroidales bacterium]
MKKSILLTVVCAFLTLPMFGQKYAYIDSEYILSNMPDYVEAQAELDRVAVEWQQEIEQQFAKIDEMYKKYQTEAITLPENMKQKREEAIIAAEQAAKDLQKKRFGKDGDLTKKREELVTPIQDRVFTAIDEYAKEKGYAFVFDVAGSMTIIYADPKWDINDQIMQKLGVTAKDDNDDEE